MSHTGFSIQYRMQRSLAVSLFTGGSGGVEGEMETGGKVEVPVEEVQGEVAQVVGEGLVEDVVAQANDHHQQVQGCVPLDRWYVPLNIS